MLHTDVVHSSSSIAKCYILPILWMTLCLFIMARIRQHVEGVYTPGESVRDLILSHTLELTHLGTLLNRGQSLVFMITLLCEWFETRV